MNLKTFLKNKFLPAEANFYAKFTHTHVLLGNAFSRCAASTAARKIVHQTPETWEFSGFSQNGEDGIIDYLLSLLSSSNKYFVEIGAGNGLENNTGYLAHVRKFAGLQIEADTLAYNNALILQPFLVESLNMFVTEQTAEDIYEKLLFKDADVFSIDIDGMDYYIAKVLFENGFRPKIIVAEYNSAFGPERSVTIPYNDSFNMFNTKYKYLYYGVSICGWKKFLSSYGYKFITVESNGVNAFFIKTDAFADGSFDDVQKNNFKENLHQLRLFQSGWEEQFEKIKNMPFVYI